MNIARILYPVESLGPGKRIGIWTCGCNHKCSNCSNPELWEFRREYEHPIKKIISIIKDIIINQGYEIDGITISGGDPFFQVNELNSLLRELKPISDDILVYTGYTLEELHTMNNDKIEENLRLIDVLIDGRYIEALNHCEVLRGSVNQNIYIFNKSLQERYRNYCHKPGMIQNFITNDGFVSVGIHKPGFKKEINNRLIERGICVINGKL